MKNKTTQPKTKKEQKWHFINAEGQTLGHISTEIAKLLTGKDKVDFVFHQNCGDKVVVTNAQKVVVTGNKKEGKIYYHHTGYPRGLRQEKLGSLLKRKPTEVLRKSVWGMLPNNKLRKERIGNLYIYAGAEHPHTAQENVK